ncbi:MAG TPA: TonB family protein [Polyangia bacterium]|nr:TonB family protein [Polyangia bacterium]
MFLLVLVAQRPSSASGGPDGIFLSPPVELAAEPVLIDVAIAPPESADLIPAPPISEPPPRLGDARPGDRDHDVRQTVAPRGVEELPRAAAADRGLAGGHQPAPAYRRDQSSLSARLTDGADTFQPARERSSARASSPQAVRREPTTGLGDAARTRTPARLPAADAYASPEPITDGARAAGSDSARAGVAAPPEVPLVAETPAAERGQGPLDAERGARSFDNDIRGPVTDDHGSRLASAERQPGITDFSHPASLATADAPTGQGPGVAPGAVARPSDGAAPTLRGAPDPQLPGSEVSERTQDRRYDRYIQEIAWRVNRQRIFPKSLALRLEQGETIVYFVLRADGKLSGGVRVVKSSGFDEFDSEAARAVLRAAPFPPMPDAANARPLPVSFRVSFENPLVR